MPKRLYHKSKNLYAKYKKPFWIITAIISFLLIFLISVAGSLRLFFPYLPQLTGFPFSQKNYLVIFQNNTELRPSGGFISSYGILSFQSGIFKGLSINDVYGDIDNHPYLEPPYPMKELLANRWYTGYNFRDGNFQADYPKSAEELIRLFHLSKPNPEIDGVIAVNFSFLEDLLEAIGPIEVEGQIFTSTNLFENLENSVNDIDRHNVEALANRKSILKPLANAIIKKIVFNPFKTRKISDTITQNLVKKDIQLYFKDQSLGKIIAKHNWDGSWPKNSINQDFLALVEANLGGMKSNRYIQRNITYHLRFDEDALQNNADAKAEVQVEMNHFGIENIPLSGPYTGYLRFYSSPDQIKPQDEIIKLNMGESKTVTKTYNISSQVLQKNHYKLFIPKQSGTDDFYSLIIEFPRGYQVQSNDFQSKENFAYFQGKLTKDAEFELTLLPDKNPPRVVHQHLSELGKIELHFNEDLNQAHASDPFSYEVEDLNKNHPKKSDELRIRKIETTSKDVTIYVTGMTEQPEEHYSVLLKNLRDTHGNILTERKITVVQRLGQAD